MVVDAFVDATGELGHVDVLVAHAEVGAEEVGVHNGSRDAHGHRSHGQVGLALHLRDGEARGRVVEQALAHVLGDRIVVAVLDVLAVDAEGGDADLGVAGEGGGEVDGARALGAVEAPDRVRHGRVHVGGLGAVAPAGGDGEGEADVVLLELLGAGLGLVHAADGRVGDDALDGGAVGVAEVLREELGDPLSHAHRLLFEALTDAAATTVDGRADSDTRVISHYSQILQFRCVVRVRPVRRLDEHLLRPRAQAGAGPVVDPPPAVMRHS